MSIDELRCGECGCRMFTLRHRRPTEEGHVGGHGSGGFGGTIVVTCTQCDDATEISVAPARLTSVGHLCGGWAAKTHEKLHLKTQRNQPYGSERRCCEECGVMLWGQRAEPPWTDDPAAWKNSDKRCRK